MNALEHRLLGEIHATVVCGAPSSSELVKAARRVVYQRFSGKEWEPLKDAINDLADVLDYNGRDEP